MSVRRIILCRHSRESGNPGQQALVRTPTALRLPLAHLSLYFVMVGEGRPSTSLQAKNRVFRASRDSRTGRPWACPKRPRLCDGPTWRMLVKRGAKCATWGKQTRGWSAFADHDAREGEARKHQ